jgi:hypothetical protein
MAPNPKTVQRKNNNQPINNTTTENNTDTTTITKDMELVNNPVESKSNCN